MTNAKRGGLLRILMPADVDTLDPQRAYLT